MSKTLTCLLLMTVTFSCLNTAYSADRINRWKENDIEILSVTPRVSYKGKMLNMEETGSQRFTSRSPPQQKSHNISSLSVLPAEQMKRDGMRYSILLDELRAEERLLQEKRSAVASLKTNSIPASLFSDIKNHEQNIHMLKLEIRNTLARRY